MCVCACVCVCVIIIHFNSTVLKTKTSFDFADDFYGRPLVMSDYDHVEDTSSFLLLPIIFTLHYYADQFNVISR